MIELVNDQTNEKIKSEEPKSSRNFCSITTRKSMGYGTYIRTIDTDHVEIPEEAKNLDFIFYLPKSLGFNNVHCILIWNKRVKISFIPPNINNNSITIDVKIMFNKEIDTIALANLLIGYRKNAGTENDHLRHLKCIMINNCTLNSDKTNIIRKTFELPETTKIIMNP